MRLGVDGAAGHWLFGKTFQKIVHIGVNWELATLYIYPVAASGWFADEICCAR